MVAIRENEIRAALLGYESALDKLAIFVIGGAIAGLPACSTPTGAFVSPTIFSLLCGQIIIWVTVGGLGTLLGPIIGCLLIQYLTSWSRHAASQGLVSNPTWSSASSWSASCCCCPRA